VASAVVATATVAQNRVQARALAAPSEVAALRAEVAELKVEVAQLKRTHARHYHYYGSGGGASTGATSRTSEPN
jgi:hypothetical protein